MKDTVIRASRLLDYIAAVAMIGLLLVVCANVASRAIFDRPIAGALESSMLLMPVIIFSGMSWVFLKVGHFEMTSLVDAIGGTLKSVSKILQLSLGFIVFFMLSVESADLFSRSMERSEFVAGPVNIPVYYSRFFICAGSIVTTAVFIFVLLPDWIRSIQQKHKHGEAE